MINQDKNENEESIVKLNDTESIDIYVVNII